MSMGSAMQTDDDSASSLSATCSSLPDDILLHVCQYLDLSCRLSRFNRVCRSWRRLTEQAEGWTAVIIPDHLGHRLEDYHLTYLCRLFRYCTTLELHEGDNVHDESLALAFLHMRSLTHLSIQACDHLTDQTLVEMARLGAAKSLRTLHWSRSEHLSDVGVSALAAAAPHLTTVILDECGDIYGTCLHALATNCTQLQHVSLPECYNVTTSGVKSLVEHCGRTLTHLTLDGIDAMDDATMQPIGNHAHNLTHLSVGGCQDITDAGIKTMTVGCPSLLNLAVRACHHLTSTSLSYIGASCPSLLHLDMRWLELVTDSGMEVLAKGCKKLISIKLAHCTNLGDGSLLSLATHCRSLELVDVSHVHQLSDVGVQQLANGLKKIKQFNCEGCYRIHASGLSCLPIDCQIHSSVDMKRKG